MQFDLFKSWELDFSDEELEEVDKVLKDYLKETEIEPARKDYCYDCDNAELYCHAMTFKCSECHKIILGGTNA